MTFGEKLLQLRKSKGMSQEQLAVQVKVSRQAISKWELGDAKPDTDNIILLSRLFGVTTDYLLDEEISDYKDNTTEATAKRSLTEHNYTGLASKICIMIEAITLLTALMFLFFTFPNLLKALNINLILRVNVLKIGVCFLLQMAAVAAFEIVYSKASIKDKNIRYSFYMLSIWLLMPIPLTYSGYIVFPLLRRPFAFLSDFLYLLIPYFIIGAVWMLYFSIKRFKLTK